MAVIEAGIIRRRASLNRSPGSADKMSKTSVENSKAICGRIKNRDYLINMEK
jgi:hypothetical protein